MKKFFFTISLLVFFIIFFNCGVIRPKVKKDLEKDPRTQAEESFDPWSLDKDEPIITKSLFSEKSKKDSLDVFRGVVKDESEKIFKTLYRVQVFATKFPQEAYQIADSLKEKFKKNIYVEYESPYYKVRLGDFEKEDDAQKFLRVVRSKGYFESWVVKVKGRAKDNDKN